MPYIDKHRRSQIARGEVVPNTEIPSRIGDLTYVIFKAMKDALPAQPGYYDYNAVLGAAEAAKLELYRRYVAKHEDLAIFRNGDID